MRRLLVPLLILASAFPAVGFADRAPADGSLAVRDGRGKVQLAVRGSIIGRLGNGSITIEELSSDADSEPVVRGYKTFRWGRNANTRTYTGKNVRFRLIGGRYRVTFNGKGLFLSLVGKGRVMLDGVGSVEEGIFYDGFYSLNDSEEESLPDDVEWLNLTPPPSPPPPPPSSRPSASS
jgi:hypothetical protein